MSSNHCVVQLQTPLPVLKHSCQMQRDCLCQTLSHPECLLVINWVNTHSHITFSISAIKYHYTHTTSLFSTSELPHPLYSHTLGLASSPFLFFKSTFTSTLSSLNHFNSTGVIWKSLQGTIVLKWEVLVGAKLISSQFISLIL